MNRKNSIYLKLEILCSIINIFTITFDDFKVSLLHISITWIFLPYI